MPGLALRLPLKITSRTESVQVADASGRVVSYTYVEDDNPLRRSEMRRFTTAEAVEIAKVIARALTDAAG